MDVLRVINDRHNRMTAPDDGRHEVVGVNYVMSIAETRGSIGTCDEPIHSPRDFDQFDPTDVIAPITGAGEYRNATTCGSQPCYEVANHLLGTAYGARSNECSVNSYGHGIPRQQTMITRLTAV
jgi:hypothetical protein